MKSANFQFKKLHIPESVGLPLESFNFIAKLGPNTPSLATIKSILSFVDTPLLAAGWFIVCSL